MTSPALGAYLQDLYSETVVIWIATAVALLDVLFIVLFVPESLPEKLRPASWGSAISWDKADPFGVCSFSYYSDKYPVWSFLTYFCLVLFPFETKSESALSFSTTNKECIYV